MNLGIYFEYSPTGIGFKGACKTKGPYLATTILSIFVGSYWSAMTGVFGRILAN